jgi:hypothetical protein
MAGQRFSVPTIGVRCLIGSAIDPGESYEIRGKEIAAWLQVTEVREQSSGYKAGIRK